MRVIVTGGLGFIGQNLAIHLRKILPRVHLTAVDWACAPAEAERAIYDEVQQTCFADPSALERCADADVIIHLAARTTVQESICDPISTFQENVLKSQQFIEHVRHHCLKATFVFASTGGAIVGQHDGPIHEQINPRPISPYGASKMAVEGLLSAYHGSFGMRAISLRFSNVYGPNSGRKGSVVSAFCKQIARSNTVNVNGDGQQTRDYIYVDDVSDAIRRVITRPDANGVYQLGTGKSTSILELAGIFQRLLPHLPPKIVHGPALDGEVRHNSCDISRIRRELGFEPQWSLEAGIQQTWDWFVGNDAIRAIA